VVPRRTHRNAICFERKECVISGTCSRSWKIWGDLLLHRRQRSLVSTIIYVSFRAGDFRDQKRLCESGTIQFDVSCDKEIHNLAILPLFMCSSFFVPSKKETIELFHGDLEALSRLEGHMEERSYP